METPETIRTSLQQAEWITSVDFKDLYVHIPIQEQEISRISCPGQNAVQTVPFPMKFMVIAREVKLG